MVNTAEPIDWVSPSGDARGVWIISIILALISCFISFIQIGLHKRFENHPKVQHYMIRMLLTMPTYGLCGALTITYPLCTVQFILIRKCMEAFMVYNFVQLLVAYFTPYATEEVRIKHLEALLQRCEKQKAKPPCCCMGTLHPGKHYLHDQVLVPVRVFVVAIPFFAIVGLLFDSYNKYGFGAQDINRAWFYLNILSIIFTVWALSGLFTVFQVLQPLLLPFVKLQNTVVHIVLGPMVLQEVIIGLIAESGGMSKLFGLSTEAESAVVLVNLLFCIESVLVGFLFSRAFSAHQFYEEEVQDKQWLRDHSAIKDVHEGDMGHHFRDTHKKPRFSVASLTPHRGSILRDASAVQFADPSVMADLADRPRRESTANDRSRLTIRSHAGTASPHPAAEAKKEEETKPAAVV